MPKKVIIGAHKPAGYVQGKGVFVRSTRNILPGFKTPGVQREIYLAAKRVQARPMRAINPPKPEPEPATADVVPFPATQTFLTPSFVTTSQKKSMSRQQRWMERQEKAGNCRRCGAKRTLYAQFCDSCMSKVRDRRNKVGNEKRPGRPLKK